MNEVKELWLKMEWNNLIINLYLIFFRFLYVIVIIALIFFSIVRNF
jgi:hypothetical protein